VAIKHRSINCYERIWRHINNRQIHVFVFENKDCSGIMGTLGGKQVRYET
jgi:hypothetical protein